ncbi:hypothetical protein LLEC1_06758 [Akanthomyces lecanii]|uniref:Beta-lactamase-related domain-containing protein n=1 Tax=Cordyceps confragosa TaxID=2714763 RepID=A0A179IKG9_CORDF|nr:hypothetical protein LLEC1_06758 [Akanthomyces lecanii]
MTKRCPSSQAELYSLRARAEIVSHFALGNLWATVGVFNGSKLSASNPKDATVDAIYDMASLTKLFRTVAVLRCLDEGLVTPNGTVVTWLPKFGADGK